MDCEQTRQYDRIRLHELLIEHPDWEPADYAREVGRSIKWVKDWTQRVSGHPLKEDFSIYQSRSRAPHTIWRYTPDIVKDVICELREVLSEKYHRTAGADTILPYLRRREDLKDAGHFVPSSTNTITRVLRERGYIQPRRPRWREPLVLPAPMAEWEMDFGEVRLADGERFEFFVVIDCGTSRVIHLEGSEGFNAETALGQVAKVLLTHGCPQRLRFDRDPRFVGSWTRDSFSSALVKFLKVMGIEPIICPPRKPWKKPFVERVIYTIKHEWLFAHGFETVADLHDLLPSFLDFYHRERIHQGKACRGRTPDEAFPSLPALPFPAERIQPNRWLAMDHGRVFRRYVTSNGTIQIDRHTYYVGIDVAKQPVRVHLDAHNREFVVVCDHAIVKRLAIRGLHEEELDLDTYLWLMMDEARSTERHRQLLWQRYGEGA